MRFDQNIEMKQLIPVSAAATFLTFIWLFHLLQAIKKKKNIKM